MSTTQDTQTPGLDREQASQLADAVAWLQRTGAPVHEVNLMGNGVRIYYYGIRDAEVMGAIARKVGGRWDKDADSDLFRLSQKIGDGVTYALVGDRASVCQRVVVGAREVEITEPDPDAVAALPKVTRTEVVEEVEWRCEPILGGQA